MSNALHDSAPKSSKARAGAMTVAMRSVRVEKAPRILRIGRMEAGRVVEERLLGKRTDVTVGSDPKNAFVLGSAGAPASMKLFELGPNGYAVTLTAGMSGRIALPTGVADVAQLLASGQKKFLLGEDGRGRIVLGDVAFLFQLVDAPPVQPRPQLPLSVRGGLVSRIDWGFSVLAAFSFLAHFGFAGAVNSDWFDPQVDDEAETASLVETVRNRPEIPLEQPKETPAPDPSVKDPAKDPKIADASPKTPDGNKKTTGNNVASHSTNTSIETSKLGDELDTLGMKVVGSFNTKGPATSIVLKPGSNAAAVEMDEMAKKKAGISTDDDKLKTAGGDNGPIGVGDKPGCIACNPVKTPTSPTTKPPTGPEPPVPTPIVVTNPPPVGDVPDADGVIARNRWRFTACYKKAMALDPSDGGTIKVTVTIGEGGAVLSSLPVSTTASAGLTSCVASSFTQMSFPEPTNGIGKFTVPVVLRQK